MFQILCSTFSKPHNLSNAHNYFEDIPTDPPVSLGQDWTNGRKSRVDSTYWELLNANDNDVLFLAVCLRGVKGHVSSPFFYKLKHQLLKWKQAIINDNYKWFSRNLWMAYEQRQSSTVRTTPFNFIPSSVLKHLLKGKGIFTLQLNMERLEYALVIKLWKKFQFLSALHFPVQLFWQCYLWHPLGGEVKSSAMLSRHA